VDYQPAFPDDLRATASTILPVLAVDEEWPAKQGFIVQVQSQQLSAPYRVYYEPNRLRSIIENYSGDPKILALCLGSRHWDGFIREECIRELLQFDRPWITPFIIQLLGEYVIQIVRLIAEKILHASKEIYGEFVRENSAFLATTKRRAISYWGCYYRHQYQEMKDYPGLISIEKIQGMA